MWERRKPLSLTIEREAFDPTIIQFGKWKEAMMESPLQLPELDRHEATSLEDARFRNLVVASFTAPASFAASTSTED